MSELDTARLLTRYNAWANDAIFEAVARLPEGEALKPRQSLFSNMVMTLHHNYIIDRIFQAHLEGRDHGYSARSSPDYPPLDELWQAQRAVDHWYIEWSRQLGEARKVPATPPVTDLPVFTRRERGLG
jgi:uncharacterized damage-inducible protein DinB